MTRRDPAPVATTETKPAKPLTPIAEAMKLAAAIARINQRESDAAANAKARYQAERDALTKAASAAAKRILAAAESDVDEGDAE